jgi:uncharacterized damage-inducible protein DinB
MFCKIDDFFESYTYLTEGTLKVLALLDEENLDQSVGEGFRTLRHLGWHIVVTVPEMMRLTGLPLSAVDPESPPPARASDIVAGYKKVTAELVSAVKAGWDDNTLTAVDDMYGQKWARGASLSALIHHEIHHRGQMMVLLRQAGSKVPGLYGPAKEEWSQLGMETPPY